MAISGGVLPAGGQPAGRTEGGTDTRAEKVKGYARAHHKTTGAQAEHAEVRSFYVSNYARILYFISVVILGYFILIHTLHKIIHFYYMGSIYFAHLVKSVSYKCNKMCGNLNPTNKEKFTLKGPNVFTWLNAGPRPTSLRKYSGVNSLVQKDKIPGFP